MPAVTEHSSDSRLIALGRELAAIPAALDRSTEHCEASALLERIDGLSDAIVATPARTLQGLFIKARATAWALEGDFDPAKESSINDRLAASIVRDLLNLAPSPSA
jgi:hypothetical protein